jgi:hypothetical protein
MRFVSPYYTFPPVGWWLHLVAATEVVFDVHEHYRKMSDRNRYQIGGSNNPVLLSIPLIKGRKNHVPMHCVQIQNDSRWQVQHWRTIVSVYNRSPYFFHYHDSLAVLFQTEYTSLLQFNIAAFDWVNQQLKFSFTHSQSELYLPLYPDDFIDLRTDDYQYLPTPFYYQVFADRIGFVSGLSILDLLFSEGPHTTAWLRSHAIQAPQHRD